MSDAAPTQEQMLSALWRIAHIYCIKDRHGKKVPFRPTSQQKEILRAIYIDRKKKLFIPKARQLGISTLVSIMILDSILFGSGVQCSICDFVSGNAKKKLEGKIVYAFEQLPAEWRMGWEVVTHNKQSGEFRLKKTGADVSDESVVFAGDQPRGDTYQILHLSELGETQVKAPERAREIFEGALPTAEASVIIIETTWHGGRVGVLYSLVLDAMETPDHKKDKERDYFVMFFPWFQEPLYTNAGDSTQVSTQTREYFSSLCSILPGVEFTEGQMLWYQKQKDRLGHRIYSLYPSRLEEIFLSPVDGAIYAKEIDEARVSGRVGQFKHDPTKPVDTLWDFGSPQNTICLYFQQDGPHFNFIDADVIETKTSSGVEINGYDINFPSRMKMMMEKPYRYGTHYIPHDGGSRDLRQRTTWQADMVSNGLQGKITVIPRTDDIWLGINKIKAEFATFRFDAVMLKAYLDGVAMYRLMPDPSDPKKFTSKPLHDFSSHLADCLKCLGEALLKGYVSPTSLMDTNIVLDPIVLAKATAEAAKPDIGEMLEHQRRLGFKPDPAGWMQKWEHPAIGSRYLLVIHRDSAQIWRAARDTSEPKDRATLAASIKVDGRQDGDVLIERACLMAKFYGDCIVIPTVNDRDSIVRDILDHECSIFKRRVKDSNRPIGRSLPPPKMGYDLDAQTRESNINALVRAFREEKLVISDTQWLMQAGTFILQADGSKVAQEGYSDTQIIASSIAVSLLDMASEYGYSGAAGNSLIRMG